MKQSIIKKILVLSVSLFFLTLVFPLLFFNKYNLHQLQKGSMAVSSEFKKYLSHNQTIVNFISSDQIIKSSILQYYANENIKNLQHRFNKLKEQYADVRFISVYNKQGNLFLSTDYLHQNKSLDIKNILNTKQKFKIEYFLDFNQFLCVSTKPFYNALNMKIGYIVIGFTLQSYWNNLGLSKDFMLFLYQNSRKILAYPFDVPIYSIDQPKPKKKYTLIRINKKTYYQHFTDIDNSGFKIKVLYQYKNRLFRLIFLINIFLFLLILFFLIFFLIQNRWAKKDEKIRKNTDELLKYSQQTLHNVSRVKDTLEDLKYKKEILNKSLEKVKHLSFGTKASSEEFKIIEPE